MGTINYHYYQFISFINYRAGQKQSYFMVWFRTNQYSAQWICQSNNYCLVSQILWKNKQLTSYGKSLFPLGICAIIALLIFIQPDLGTSIIYVVIVGVMFLAAPVLKEIKMKTIFGLLGLVVFAGVVFLGAGKSLLQERQLERFDFRNPCDKLLTTGNQVCNCYIAINNGGLTGVGLGNSTQSIYTYQNHTQISFCNYCRRIRSNFWNRNIIVIYVLII